MTKVMIKKIETCHDCPKLEKSNKFYYGAYGCEPPKRFVYMCQRWKDKNHSYFERALTTRELIETCPLQDYEDVIKE